MKRLFIAIPVNPQIKEACSDFISANRQVNTRWIKEENWHITTIFIGDFPAEKISDLIHDLDIFFKKSPMFQLTMQDIGYAPSQKKPRMIWVRFNHHSGFDRFILNTYNCLKNFYKQHKLNFGIEIRQKNTAHITLTRLKKGLFTFPELNFEMDSVISMNVRNCQVWESELLPNGAQYTCLHDFGIGA